MAANLEFSFMIVLQVGHQYHKYLKHNGNYVETSFEIEYFIYPLHTSMTTLTSFFCSFY